MLFLPRRMLDKAESLDLRLEKKYSDHTPLPCNQSRLIRKWGVTDHTLAASTNHTSYARRPKNWGAAWIGPCPFVLGYQYAHIPFRYAHLPFRYVHPPFRCGHPTPLEKSSEMAPEPYPTPICHLRPKFDFAIQNEPFCWRYLFVFCLFSVCLRNEI